MSDFGIVVENSKHIQKYENRYKKHNLKFSGLEEYLKNIYPDSDIKNDWINDYPISKLDPNVKDKKGHKTRCKPDWINMKEKIIIEFDEPKHYKNVGHLLEDERHRAMYRDYGYTVIEIPYFIQLTRNNIKIFFGIDVGQEMFPKDKPYFFKEIFDGTPADLCPEGLKKMCQMFAKVPDWYELNLQALKEIEDDCKESKANDCKRYYGYELLKKGMEKYKE